MQDITLGLALYDYLPSVFTGLALFFIYQMTHTAAPSHSWLAGLGGTMIVLGGVLKATWKLVVALGGPEIIWLSEPLFPLMAPGFLFVTIAVYAGMRATSGQPVPFWLTGLGFALVALTLIYADVRVFVQQIERGWFFPLLLLASIANVTLSVMLITGAMRRRRWVAAGLLFLNIAMVFALQPIAAMDDLSITMHWIEQTLTVGGATAFAVGAHLMSATMREEVRGLTPATA